MEGVYWTTVGRPGAAISSVASGEICKRSVWVRWWCANYGRGSFRRYSVVAFDCRALGIEVIQAVDHAGR